MMHSTTQGSSGRRFGEPGFFLLLSAVLFALSLAVLPYLKQDRDIRFMVPRYALVVVAFAGFVPNVLRWKNLSPFERFVLLLLPFVGVFGVMWSMAWGPE